MTISKLYKLAVISMIAVAAHHASAQEYPVRAIRIVTPGVGGSADFSSRLLAQAISGPLGQQVVIDNRPTGPIPGEIVSKAAPDGYTLLLSGGSFFIGPLVQKTSYDPITDFVPISLTATQPNVLVVHPSMPVKSVKDLIAIARAKPGSMNYAIAGNGTVANCAILANAAGAQGGGIYGAYNQTRVLNTTIAGNTAATAGGVYMYNNALDVRNTVLWSNSATTGSTEAQQATLSASASATFATTRLQGWSGSLGGVGNSGADPLFADLLGPDGVARTFHDSGAVRPDSPCVDAGRNSDVPLDLLDLNGNGSITESDPIDVVGGARFIDDPATPDTGVGTAPIVDIGAYEFVPVATLFVPCYANCDSSTQHPVLNVGDFACFLQKYAAADGYANCDGSTTPPVINVSDFTCFLQKYAAGCP